MCHFQIEQLCEQITDVKHRISNMQDDTFVHGYRIGEQMAKAGTKEIQPFHKRNKD